ncbi:DUF397 domain-containing protein [Actinacidiphila alni]|uniref:DUF397 domain-containing protein n=1 Tax=Actinacidiphila alni TaxID=380248 RepID=UPI00345568A7
MPYTPDVIGPFTKSTHSGAEGNCVEVAATANGGRAVRDSKDPSGPVLTFPPAAWAAFLGAVEGFGDR